MVDFQTADKLPTTKPAPYAKHPNRAARRAEFKKSALERRAAKKGMTLENFTARRNDRQQARTTKGSNEQGNLAAAIGRRSNKSPDAVAAKNGLGDKIRLLAAARNTTKVK